MKKANPSAENGMPMMPPAYSMNPGQSSPSSKESTVPETAPTANRMAKAFDQRFASARQAPLPVRRYMPSAITINRGRPIPRAAKMM